MPKIDYQPNSELVQAVGPHFIDNYNIPWRNGNLLDVNCDPQAIRQHISKRAAPYNPDPLYLNSIIDRLVISMGARPPSEVVLTEKLHYLFSDPVITGLPKLEKDVIDRIIAESYRNCYGLCYFNPEKPVIFINSQKTINYSDHRDIWDHEIYHLTYGLNPNNSPVVKTDYDKLCSLAIYTSTGVVLFSIDALILNKVTNMISRKISRRQFLKRGLYVLGSAFISSGLQTLAINLAAPQFSESEYLARKNTRENKTPIEEYRNMIDISIHN